VRILELLEERGVVSVGELERELRASGMTIRRDLVALDATGQARRTRGGAMAINHPEDVPFQRRERLELSAKRAIGRAAASLVQPGETILLDAGTTVLAMAQALPPVPHLTVVTNSVQVLHLLWNRTNLHMVALGGAARPVSGSLTGALAEQALENLRVDRAFLGASGISDKWEVSNRDLEAAAIQRRILKVAHGSYLLADHTKFHRTNLAVVGSLSVFTGLITDSGLPARLRKRLQQILPHVVFA
jgi:DeoR/GlpR family transcriptional regulator of sugar metabolism